MRTCPRCGEDNPDRARFCLACAAPLVAAPASRDERKVVTVLFADLVGFTARAEQLDPEDVHALQEPYWQRLRAEIERYGGTVEKFIGDAVMALFGAPVAHEDDPERAVRAALAVRDWARAEEAVDVRLAVVTGEALVRLGAEPLAGEGMASGDVVNTAARLQTAAPANGILVGAGTYELTKHVIDYREQPPVEAKGKAAPVAVWEALDARTAVGVEQEHAAQAPLVGRDRERELLLSTLARVREDRSTQLVTLVGVPGIGKSRLVDELRQAAAGSDDGVEWQRGRSLPYGDGVSLWALAEIVKGVAGIAETDTDEQAAEKLAETVRNVVGDDAEATSVETHLRPLVGLGGDGDAADAPAAWRHFVEALADRRPLVLVFEDLHWADEALLDFVEELVEWVTQVPLLVVGTARPELLRRRPTWAGGKANAATLSLTRLSDEETARLVALLLERSLLPAETLSALLTRAGGNPLYTQQYVHMLSERGDGGDLPLPASVQGIIAARLDSLQPEEKSLLQDAAVVGTVFWSGAIAAMHGSDRAGVETLLHSLERREFVQRARRSSVAGEDEYSFGHVLLLDVAYGQIPRAARATKHERAARWLEGVGRSDDHAEILAHHYTSALELARATGGAGDELTGRARASLVQAGERAFALNAYAAAARFYARALELSCADDADYGRLLLRYGQALHLSEQRGDEVLAEASAALLAAGDVESAAEAECELGTLAWEGAQTDTALPHMKRALELVRDRPASHAKAAALIGLARIETFTGDPHKAIQLGREALAAADQLDSEPLRADALNYIGCAAYALGDLAEGAARLEESLRAALAADAPQAMHRAYSNLIEFLDEIGDGERAGELLGEALALAERAGNPWWLATHREQLLRTLYRSGRWDEAEVLGDAIGQPFLPLDVARGRGTQALTQLEAVGEQMRATKRPDGAATTFTLEAHALCGLGRPEEAQAVVTKLMAELRRPEARAAFSPWPILAEVLAELGRLDELAAALEAVRSTPWSEAARAYGRSDFAAAAELYERLQSLPQVADARLRAAQELLAEGNPTGADEQLEQALAFYRSVGHARRIAEAEAVRARIAATAEAAS